MNRLSEAVQDTLVNPASGDAMIRDCATPAPEGMAKLDQAQP
jgi:hypothetical protein